MPQNSISFSKKNIVLLQLKTMFIIEPKTNTIKSLIKKTFSELEFKERAHLQEWIAENPESLGEKLLIIQKEFSGFNDTNERLDLMALDKDGNIVIIENKLDDSGKDVTWQALKYSAYASTLTKEQIEEIFQGYLKSINSEKVASQVLSDFFLDLGKSYNDILLNRSSTQRIILIAANFRKEVTSTVLWLMNFKVKLQCIKATPYSLDEQHFLTLEQIIPIKDAQDYIISMANKVQEEISNEVETKTRHTIRLKFWEHFLSGIKGKSALFQKSNPTKDHWLVAGGTGITNATYQVIITMNGASVMLNFGRANKEQNKLLFDYLYSNKTDIEILFGDKLVWERMDEFKSSKISFSQAGLNYFNEDEWGNIVSFLIEFLNKIEHAFKPYLQGARTKLIDTIQDTKEQIIEELN